MSFSKHTLVGLITLGAAAGMGTVSAETISVSCGAVGQELQLCKAGAEAWAKQSGHQINLISTPNSSTERLALYQQLLAAGAADIDVFQIDVIWPGTLANHLIDLKEYVGDAPDEHFSALIENNTVNGQLIAMPWYTDAGLLYYRKDLLEKYREKPPETWEQLTATAQNIQDAEREAGNNQMWGYVWQGRAYEGLTCNALEWVASHGGGTLISQDGKVTINNPDAATALDQAGSWVGTITPQGVLNYTEEEARGVFQSGNAVFMRNWPYAWALAQGPDSPIKDKVGVSALPKGGEDGQHVGVLGGWQLAVSKYSRHPEIAADLVKYLTSAAEQKRRAIEGAFNPTIESLYKDEEVLAANPFFGDLYEVFTNAVPRPSSATGDKYNQVSKEFWSAAHSVLSGQQSGEAAVAQLENTLNRMSRGGRGW